MKTVEIPLPEADIGTSMNDMRQWIDQQQLEPSIFTVDGTDGTLERFAVVRVTFNMAEQARSFADRFAGRVL